MRAERPGASGGRGEEPVPAEGFGRAMREAEARVKGEKEERRKATSPPAAVATPTPTPIATPTAPLDPTPTAPPDPTPTPDPGAAAARAVAVVTALREGGQPALHIASADGIRYEVASGPQGVELRASAPPLLERVARADLHAVAGAIDRRGIALSRAAVRVEGGAEAGRRKR